MACYFPFVTSLAVPNPNPPAEIAACKQVDNIGMEKIWVAQIFPHK
jgi:hypothetical protein